MTTRTFSAMGTVVSLTSTDAPGKLDEAVAGVKEVFAAFENQFSLYRPSSELSRIASGDLRFADASSSLRALYGEALDWRRLTDGAFTANRPDGVIDLNGIVKARALRVAGSGLSGVLAHEWELNAGGDVLVSSAGATIGIVDPLDRQSLLCAVTVTGSRRAVATSGTAERGDHIWARGFATTTEYCQATVVADDIETADILATAIIAGGRETRDSLTDRFSIDVLTVGRRGELEATPGFRSSLAGATGVEQR